MCRTYNVEITFFSTHYKVHNHQMPIVVYKNITTCLNLNIPYLGVQVLVLVLVLGTQYLYL